MYTPLRALFFTALTAACLTAQAQDSKRIASLEAQVNQSAASYVYSKDSTKAMHDGQLPKYSGDLTIPRYSAWPKKGSEEWVSYSFEKPQLITDVAVYWFDDRENQGGSRAPSSWKLQYLNGDAWQDVTTKDKFGVGVNALQTVRIDPITTTGLKITVQFQKDYSGGILEWRVNSAEKDVATLSDAEKITFFKSKVKPILEENCHKCHGLGSKQHPVKSEFHLTSHQNVVDGGALGPAVNLKDPLKSHLLEGINYGNPEFMMPPKQKLSQDKIDILTTWVKMGVPFDPSTEQYIKPQETGAHVVNEESKSFWAFQPVGNPEPPKVKDKRFGKHPIDRYIYEALSKEKLKPMPRAEKEMLLRRVTYDLTGLAPTMADMKAFLNDTSSSAYEKVLDRLLSSPHFGEKWGRHWLDLVRYAETNGYERDAPKEQMWRYRDYVIGAFNQDMPYNRFILEQLAGDELEDRTSSSRIATGFYRLGVWDDEPANRELAYFDYLDDILKTTSESFLGLTVACARCHDHKIDPIPTADYYKLLAFFRDIKPHGTGNTNTEDISSPEDKAKYNEAIKVFTEKEGEIFSRLFKAEQEIMTRAAKKYPDLAKGTAQSDLTEVTYKFFRDTWDELPDFSNLRAETEGPLGNNFISLAPASRPNFIGLTYAAKLVVPEAGKRTFHFRHEAGLRVKLDGKVIYEKTGLGRRNDGKTEIELTAGAHPFEVEYFNKDRTPFIEITWQKEGQKPTHLARPDKPGNQHFTLRGNPKLRDMKALANKHGKELLGEEGYKNYQNIRRELDQHRRNKPKAPSGRAMVVAENGKAKTHILRRGSPANKGDEVQPAFLSVLSPPDPELKRAPAGVRSSGKRTALAKWIASDENPMTAKVMVNRLWQHLFGLGLVESSSDYGKLGLPPSHPELLNWMARDFMSNGWKVKRMIKQIMMSETYQMTSRGSEEQLAQDPRNKFLWRHSMRRLSAEEVRDSILQVSNSLLTDIGGPSIYTEIPREVLATASRPGSGWRTSPPDKRDRRSVYIHIKRSLQDPMLSVHDQADPDNHCAVRFATTVPTQSLVMMNSKFMNEQATRLANRIKKDIPSDLTKQVAYALVLATGRRVSGEEITQAVGMVKEYTTDLQLSEKDALERFCLMVLNMNEFIYLD